MKLSEENVFSTTDTLNRPPLVIFFGANRVLLVQELKVLQQMLKSNN